MDADTTVTPYKLSIFGSCVSRDILNHGQTDLFQLKTYIARQTVISSISAPCSPEVEEESINLTSAFQRRMVLSDTQKTAFTKFSNDNSEYLIIDLIDERLGMINFRNSVVTNSMELVGSGLLTGSEAKAKYRRNIFNVYTTDFKPIEPMFKEFCERIKQIYPQKKIIIHIADAKTKYRSTDGKIKKFPKEQIKKSHTFNRMYSTMYGLLVKYLPDANIIDICHNYYASESHHWGLNIIHYEDEYYQQASRELIKIIKK